MGKVFKGTEAKNRIRLQSEKCIYTDGNQGATPPHPRLGRQWGWGWGGCLMSTNCVSIIHSFIFMSDKGKSKSWKELIWLRPIPREPSHIEGRESRTFGLRWSSQNGVSVVQLYKPALFFLNSQPMHILLPSPRNSTSYASSGPNRSPTSGTLFPT